MVRKERRGCEWESPIYRQIIAENQHVQSRVNGEVVNIYKKKRGKHK